MTITEAAPAKVNLYLHVTGKRADGYHLLDSLAVFGPAQDVVRAAPSAGLGLALTGPMGTALATEPDNLVLRAARALAEAGGIAAGAALELEKHLPVASGIGGGSADCAAALRALNQLWGLRFDTARLEAIGLKLGADVPVCVTSRPLRMQGVGEVLLPAPTLPACGLLLVNPGVGVATPAVFKARAGAAFTPAAELPEGWGSAREMAATLASLRNDLEAPAVGLCPVIAEVLAALRTLPGCLLARMSGSGATCFGLFETPAAAQAAAALMPGVWWRHGGGLYAAPG